MPDHTTGGLPAAVEGHAQGATGLERAVPTSIAVAREAVHPAPWIIAMDCTPQRAAERDRRSRWAAEPTFPDLEGRSSGLQDIQPRTSDRLDHMLLIMTPAMCWCVDADRQVPLPSP
ncbi:MAG: hypothetical protein GY946_22085 [bacterium]|nr:hypothetical protein [bacterium]